jgi:hypothetical protein
MRLWPAFKASRTPPVDGLEQSERLSWIQQPLMLRHWPLPRSSRRSAGRGAGVAWFDDSALYYGAPADVLAQGDIVVAATGVFEGDHGDVSTASPLLFGEERLVQVWLGSTHTLPEAPSLGLRAR